MKFTANFYTRIIGGILLGYGGWRFGVSNSSNPPTSNQQWATSLLVLCGVGIGMLLTHHVTLYPFRYVMGHVRRLSLIELLVAAAGLIGGLFIGVLLAVPLGRLPGILGIYLPLAAAGLAAYIGLTAMLARRTELERWWVMQRTPPATTTEQRLLMDTSVIIDGRISEVVQTGFVCGRLVVPRFVLQEVQQLANSGDPLTRAKGKRGLEMLQYLQEHSPLSIEISDLDLPVVREVDDKLVALARAEKMSLLTNDGNLQKIAALQDVRVLNLNALADAVRTPFTTGDHLKIVIRDKGHEREQGVGFLNDGTMVVVEDARTLIGSEVAVVVTRLFTTKTGRILFARLQEQAAAVRAG